MTPEDTLTPRDTLIVAALVAGRSWESNRECRTPDLGDDLSGKSFPYVCGRCARAILICGPITRVSEHPHQAPLRRGTPAKCWRCVP